MAKVKATALEPAEDVLARARAIPSPVRPDSYGYFVAKTGELAGARAVAESCKALWERHAGERLAAGTELHVSEGVLSWENDAGVRSVRIVRRNAETGQIAATDLPGLDA